MKRATLLFASTIFVSAGLLFFVQPMFAKMVLPILGGSTAVWTTAMLFFQTALLAGYAYAHLLVRRVAPVWQAGIHLGLLLTGLAFLPMMLPDGTSVSPDGSPVVQTLWIFALGVGIPFLALAANAPLLQSWYARVEGAQASDPYWLYAASNAGSMIALMAFPVAAEPFLGAAEISTSWAFCYGALVLAITICALTTLRAGRGEVAVIDEPVAPVSYSDLARWAGFAFVPSSLMLGVTALISRDLGSFPLIWVLTLGLYLLSYVVAFSIRLHLGKTVLAILIPAALIGALLPWVFPGLLGNHLPIYVFILAGFFAIALALHTKLYQNRPPASGLTPFYFAMAAGGALGGIFNSLLAPVLFPDLWELPVVLVLAGLALSGSRQMVKDVAIAIASGILIIGIALGLGHSDLLEGLPITPFHIGALLTVLTLFLFRAHALRFTGTAAMFFLFSISVTDDNEVVLRERSFFGIHKVREDPATGMRQLIHGSTQHGAQMIADTEGQLGFLGYYHLGSPFGQILMSDTIGAEARIGVVGLGVGALACYSRPGQDWRFYEIDPVVDEIARNTDLFTYLHECTPEAPTVLGDARITLQRETGAPFDVLVIDAYSSDAIPVHLITQEAMELYLSRLTPSGILIFHISNRYYDLTGVIAAAASTLGIPAMDLYVPVASDDPDRIYRLPTHVAVLSRDQSVLDQINAKGQWQVMAHTSGPLWTDDHSSLLNALR